MSSSTPPSRAKYRKRDSNANHRRIQHLQRRLMFLGAENARKQKAGIAHTYESAEEKALRWVLDTVVKEWLADDPFVEVDWRNIDWVQNASDEDVHGLLGTVVFWRRPNTVSEPGRYRVVAAGFVSKLDENPTIRLGLIPTMDSAPYRAHVIVANKL